VRKNETCLPTRYVLQDYQFGNQTEGGRRMTIKDERTESEAIWELIMVLDERNLLLQERVANLELELQLLRAMPAMNRAGEEYWNHG
jgi:hypothetical protein